MTHRSVWARGLVGLGGGLAMVAAGFVSGPAHASQPSMQHYTTLSSYPLSSTDIGCSGAPFTIDVVGVDQVIFQTFYDHTGAAIANVLHDDFAGTETGNGVTLNSSEHATITDNLVTGTETWVGQPLKISLPHGRTVTLDAGKLVYASDGSITVEHGPHPFINGDVVAYCAAFGA